jgi:predicted glutamine amidotransferase
MRTGIVMQEQQHPFSEEAWSLAANGGTKYRQNRAVRGRHNGVATLLEFGEQYALAIPEHST